MDSGVQRFKCKVNDALGISALPQRFLRFSGVHTLFLIFTNLNAVFINTLLFRVSGSSTVMNYNLILFVCIMVAIPLANLVIRKTSTQMCAKIGILFYAFLYI